MVKIGDEFWLVYPPLTDTDDEVRVLVKVLSAEEDGGSFDVRDLATEGDDWTVFQHEIDDGLVNIMSATTDCIRADSFEAIVGDLEFETPDVHIPDYSSMSRAQLTNEWLRVKDALADSGRLFVQHTEQEKDLRTQYDALMIEMRRRDEKK